MKSQNIKSSDQLKREVDQQVHKVRKDLDNIQGRLTPGQLIDDAIFYPKGRNLTSTFNHLKNNPVGTAFLSLGTILLMEDENHLSMEANAKSKVVALKDTVSSVKDTIKQQLPHKELTPGMAPSSGDIAKGKVSHLKESLQSKVSELKENVIHKKEEVAGKFSGVKENLSTRFDEIQNRFAGKESSEDESNFSFSGAEETRSRFKEKASLYKEKATHVFSSGKDRIQNLDPVSFMALGAGLGALTGAALPVSEKELSIVSEKFDDKLSNLGTDLQDAINECSNILKDLVIQDVKDYQLQIFK